MTHYMAVLVEAARVVNLSNHKSFLFDLQKYENVEIVNSEIKKVVRLFMDRNYSTLKSEYNDHELSDNLKGYRSIHLFPNSSQDVVVVYKSHQNEFQISFHRIGDHAHVYDSEYKKMDKNRRMKK